VWDDRWMHEVFGQRRTARRMAYVLLCLAWFATAATGACLPHAHSSVSDPGLDRHELAGHVGGTGDVNDACCLLTEDARSQPAFVAGSSPAKPKPTALPARDAAVGVQPSTLATNPPASVATLFSSLPFYLLYKRLLIPAFS
jgi:hypothetical protein